MTSRPDVEVLLSHLSFYPVYSGPALRFRRYLPGLRRRGIRPQVLSGTPQASEARTSDVQLDVDGVEPGAFLPDREVEGVPVRMVRLPETGGRARMSSYMKALVRRCADPASRPDVIQLLALNVFSVPGLLRLRARGVPTVFTYTLLGELSDRPLKRWLQRIYIRLPFQLVDRVVVSSSVMRDELLELGVRTPVDIIPNGVDVDRFRPARDRAERMAVREALGIPEEAPLALAIGSIMPRKRPDLILEAWRRVREEHPEAHLVLAGPRHDQAYERYRDFGRRIRELVEATGAPETIHFPGKVDDVEAYMRAADLFLFASRREGMPNVIPEAMACGLPVVTTPFIGLPDEFGREGVHYELVEGGREMAVTISSLLDDEARRTRLGRAGRAWMAEHLDLDRTLDRYAALYRELAT